MMMRFPVRDNIIEILRKNGWFILGMLVFFSLFILMQISNGRFWMHDYEVYYSASGAFIHGGEVYGIPFGLSSGFYKYSPFALILFMPFSFLPFFTAKVLHFIILSVFIITSIILSKKLSDSYLFSSGNMRKNNLILYLIFIPLLTHVYRELHLGNINIIILFIYLTALFALLKGKEVMAGMLIALSVFLKPHFIVFIPLLLLRRKFRAAGATLAGLAAGFMIPSVFSGIAHNGLLHREWLSMMQAHNVSLIGGQDTIYAWIYKSIVQFIYPGITGHDKWFALFVLGIIALAFLFLVLAHLRKERLNTGMVALAQKNIVFEFILLLALIPNITVTDTEHFLLSLPLIAFIVKGQFRQKGSIVFKIAAILILVLYGLNIRDLVGAGFSSWLADNGMLGLANMLIIAFGILFYNRLMRMDKENGRKGNDPQALTQEDSELH